MRVARDLGCTEAWVLTEPDNAAARPSTEMREVSSRWASWRRFPSRPTGVWD